MGQERKKHVLLAEEEEGLQVVLSLLLRQADYQVSVVQNGQDAFRIIARLAQGPHAVDLLITDLDLDQSEGDELLARIAAAGISLPVIVLTGLADEQEPPGPDCVARIGKPFDSATLMNSVQAVLHGSGWSLEPHQCGLNRMDPKEVPKQKR